ncbi:MAG: DUF3293 domain-containing protein [Wenzhouxiangellaceae bacterium]
MPEPATAEGQLPDPIPAFIRTEYRVRLDGRDQTVQIGGDTAALDLHLGGAPWCILTAHNPGAELQSATDNRRADARLVEQLRECGFDCYRACNHDPSGQWPDEPGWLFAFDDEHRVHSLARAFGQVAVVAGQAGQAAGLWMYCSHPPAQAAPHVRCIQI